MYNYYFVAFKIYYYIKISSNFLAKIKNKFF